MDNDNREITEITGLRNHFTYIFEEAWKTVVAILVIFLFNDSLPEIIVELQSGDWIPVLIFCGVAAVIFLLIFLFFVNRWRKTYITVKEGMLTVERKLLMHYRNEISIANISNINLEQNIFEMIAGTYKLKIDTNSYSTAEKTDVKIVLKSDVAYMVKNVIMQQMLEIKAEEAPEDGVKQEIVAPAENRAALDMMGDIAEEQYDIIYDNKTIIRNCIAKTSVFLVLFIIAVFIGMGYQINSMIDEGKTLVATLVTMFATLIVNISLIRALISGWLKDFRFRAKRFGDKIYVSCGLLKKKKYAIPINMVNGVRIYNSFIGRLMNLYCVEIISVGGEEEDALGKMVLLAEKPDELRKKLAIILPEYEFPEFSNIKRMPKKVLMMRYIKGLLFFALVSAGAYIILRNTISQAELNLSNNVVLITGGVILGLFVFYCVIGTLSYFLRGLYIGENDLIIAEGCFARRIITISYDKIQYIEYSQGFFDRMIKVGRANVSILATTALSTHATGKYDMDVYEKLNEKLRETY